MQKSPRIPTPQTALQNAILQIPACLQEAINRGPRPKYLVWATDKDDHLMKVLHTSQDVSRALCQKYTVHPRTSAAEPDHSQRPVYVQMSTLTPARVWIHEISKTKENLKQTKAMANHKATPKFQYVSSTLGSAPISPYAWGAPHPTTTLPHPPVSWAEQTVRSARLQYIATKFKLHETFNDEGIHGRELCSRTATAGTRGRAARQVMLRIKDPLLPAYLYDRLYKILISGYYVGPNKPGRKDPIAGQCAACHAPENVAHIFLYCGGPFQTNTGPYQLWTSLLKWWKKRTKQDLYPTHRTLLLGLVSANRDGASIDYPDVKQAFLFLRACACSVLWAERCRIRSNAVPRTTERLHTVTMNDIQKHVNLLYTSACYWDDWNPPQENQVHPRSVQAFQTNWVSTGLVTIIHTKKTQLRRPTPILRI